MKRPVAMALIVSAIVPFATMVAASCKERRPSAPVPAGPAQVYTTRGVIAQVPEAGRPANLLQIHHEAIPAFINQAGETVGMQSHVMPFPTLAPGVSLEGLTVGDKVGFTFEVTWGGESLYRVTELGRLPPDTPLSLGGHSGG